MKGTDNETIVNLIQSEQGDRNELLTELWEKNLGLIRKIIHQTTGLDKDRDRQDFEDLEQQAFLGILNAIERYDYASGYKFFTFATHHIRKAIFRYYDRAGQTMRIPEYMQTRIRKYLQAKRDIESEGKTASSTAIRERIGISAKAIEGIEKTLRKIEIQSLDTYLDESDKTSGTVLDMIESGESTEESVIESVYETELHEKLRQATATLPRQEREIIELLYYQGYSMESIGTLYGITKQGISENLKRSYNRIRTGRYGSELVTFLPERSAIRQQERIERETDTARLDLTDREKDLLI